MIPQELLRKIRQIEIRTRRLVDDFIGGEYHSVFKGRGMEFDEVRTYQPGDDIRTIDWNVTARTGSLHIKRYVEERELTVFLLVDASGSQAFGSEHRFKSELAAELAAILAFSAIKNKDRVGLIIFTDRVEHYLPPRKGKTHVLRLIRDLLYFKPTGKRTDLRVGLDYLLKIQKRKAVAFLLSDFLCDLTDPANKQALAIANRKHDLVAMALSDPRETTIPAVGLVEIEDAETGELLTIDASHTAVRKHLTETTEHIRSEREQILRSLAIDSVELNTETDTIKPLVSFFTRRARRA